MSEPPTRDPHPDAPPVSSPREPGVPSASPPAPVAPGSASVVDRWGPSMTVLLTAGVFLIDVLLQGIILVAFVIARVAGDETVAREPEAMQQSMQPVLEAHFGWLLSLSLVLSAPLVILAILGLAKLRGPVREYLALKGFSWKVGLAWTAACAAFLVGFEIVARALERPPVPDFMVDAYTTVGSLPLLYAAIVVAAPLFEELLFRGFLLPPLADSRLGATGAVILTSAAFAVIHMQYDLFDMTAVFGLGVLLGAARLHSGSTTLVILLHAAINLVATVQAGWVIGG